MKVRLKVDERRGFAWQDELAARLAAAGHAVAVSPVSGSPPWPHLVDLVSSFEQLAFRYRGPALYGPRTSGWRSEGESSDLTVDLSGREGVPEPGTVRLLFEGSPNPLVALSVLLDGRVPRLSLERDGRIVATGLPANERPEVLSAGLDYVFARAIDLLVAAMDAPRVVVEGGHAPPPNLLLGLRPARFALASLTSKLSARLLRRLTEPASWRVGFRRHGKLSIRDTGLVPDDGFAWLPQDGARYFADPFLFEHEGRLWCFLEEFPYATGIGILSAVALDASGRPDGAPRPVLETGSHLSYPYVFASGGAFWMIPESQAAGEVALYRATDFPWRWTKHRVLVEALASDATPVWHEGRLWLFAAMQSRSESGRVLGSSWDALGLWSAPDLEGDFVPHPANPVLVDAGASRPAGRFWRRGDALMRVAQDCRGGYGAGLALCRVDRLDAKGFVQSVERIVTAPATWQASGLHTLDVAGGVEAIDCLAAAPINAGPAARSGRASAPPPAAGRDRPEAG